MRTDLRLACDRCLFRLPEGLAACPQCKGPLVRELDVASPPPLRKKLEQVHVVRDAFLYLPLVLFAIATIVLSLLLVVLLLKTQDHGSTSVLVNLVPLAALGCLAGGAILGTAAWIPYALLVMLVFALVAKKATSRDSRVAVLLFADLVPQLAARADEAPWMTAARRAVSLVSGRGWQLLVILGLLWAVASLGALAHDRHVLGKPMTAEVVGLGLLAFAVSQFVALVMVGFLFGIAKEGALFVGRRLLVIARAAKKRAALRAANSRYHAREPLTKDRACVEGKLIASEPSLVSPVGGRPCVGFQVRGMAQNIEINDLEMSPFALSTADGEVSIRGRRIAVLSDVASNPAPVDQACALRLGELLRGRGIRLPAGASVEVAELVFEPGVWVRAFGALASENSGEGAGYRTVTLKRILTDADGPILLELCAEVP